MNEQEKQRLIEDYLGRLAEGLGDVPASQRRELMEDVRGHVEDAWAASPDRSRAALLSILERLGEPEVLAGEERERLGAEHASPRQGPDILALAAIVLTALFWPVGVLLAWASPRWATRDKAVATALPLLGLLLLLTTMMAASVAVTQGPVRASETRVNVETVGPGQERLPEARQPQVEARPGSGVAVRIIGMGLSLYCLVGAPFTAAIYLALRMQPRPHRAATLLPVAAAALAVFSLLAMFLLPAQGL